MLKKVMAVVLLGFLGLTAGVAFGVLFPSYEIADALELPAHSPHSASDVVIMTQDDHPGVRVVAYGGRLIEFSATGSLRATERAVNLAIREVIAANNGKVKRRMFHGMTLQLPLSGYGLKGLLAGLGTALGFLVPPRSRVTTTA